MSTAWSSPLPILHAPHPTPVSTNFKSLKRPIHNPYDKFSKPEFDEWINGITGALRRALGHQTEEHVVLDEHQLPDVNLHDEDTFQDQSFEDSFADIQSRRAKGKAKDPREGPGLGAQQNPIELLSESESGSEVVNNEYDDEEVQGEEDYEGFVQMEPEVHDGRDQAWHWPVHDRRVPPRIEKHEVEEISSREQSPEIIEIGSDQLEISGASVHEAGNSVGQHGCSPQLTPHEVEDNMGPVSAFVDKEEYLLDAEVEDFPLSATQCPPSPPLDLPDPWQGPRTYTEDFYSGGDFSPQNRLNGVSPSRLTPVHDTHVNTHFSQVQNDEFSVGVFNTDPTVINVDVADDVLPDSSPPPSSPIEERSSRSRVDDQQPRNVPRTHEEPDNILDHLYLDPDPLHQDERQMISTSSFDFNEFHSGSMSDPLAYPNPNEHLDWNWPPAFRQGKFASRAGHLESSLSRGSSDDGGEAHIEHIIGIDSECNEEEDEDEAAAGPIPLGTSDLGCDDELHSIQDEQSCDQELDEEERHFRGPECNQFSLPAESRPNGDERAAVESFIDLLNSREVSPTNVIECIQTTLGDISDIVAEDAVYPPRIEKTDIITAPLEALEPGDGELQSQHLGAKAEASASLEPIEVPATKIQNRLDSVDSLNVEDFHPPSAVLSSGSGDSLFPPDAEPTCVVVESEATTPVSRSMSEGIEVTSLAGQVPHLDREYIVKGSPTAEASVDPEVEVQIMIGVLGETVPVTPEPIPAKLFSSDASAFPMPIFGDPSAPDPIISSQMKHPQHTPPRLVKLPGTPHIILSPHPTPGQPTPVSVSVSTSMLHAFSRRVSPSEGSSGPSGLFTPREGEPIGVSTGDVFDTSSPSNTGLPLPSADGVLASVSSALAAESQAKIDASVINAPENFAVTDPSPGGTSTRDRQGGTSEFAEDAQLSALEYEDVQHVVGSTVPAAADQRAPLADGHPEEAQASVEDLPSRIPRRAHPSLLSDDPFQVVVSNGQGFVPEDDQDDNGEDAGSVFSQSGLGHFTNVPDRPHESPHVQARERSSDAEDQSNDLKRKRMSSVQPTGRLTRSMSSRVSAGHKKKSQGDRKTEWSMYARGRKRNLLDVKDSGSDHGSVSSGVSTAAKMLQFAEGSRASSILSTAPSNSSLTQHPPISPPLFHAHGVIHHRHGLVPPPTMPVQTQVNTKTASPEPSRDLEGQKDFPSVSAIIRTPSANIQHLVAPTNSPVTRSNCRFHKVSLPKEEGGPRVCFVVPGCSLGDKELMDEEEIHDHGPATHEDYSRLVGNIEALDFDPHLVGILRQLVGVDLIRENEIFYLLQPGEEAHYKKKGRKSTAGSKLASSTMARSAPNSPHVSATSWRSPVTSISRPPISTAGSMTTSCGSFLSEAQLYKHSSILLSTSGEELSDRGGSASPKPKRRRKESVFDEKIPTEVEGDNVPQDPGSKGPHATHALKRSRSKRADLAAYRPRPEDEDDTDGGTDVFDKGRRKANKSRAKKRTRVADEEHHSQRKKHKQKLGPNE